MKRWPGMSAKRLNRFGDYVRATANQLGLRDWTFRISHTPLLYENPRGAEIECMYGKREAIVRLRSDFQNHSKDQQRQTLVHELVHCHFAASRRVTRQGGALWLLIGDSVGDMLRCQLNDAEEDAVDALACAIAEFLPLP